MRSINEPISYDVGYTVFVADHMSIFTTQPIRIHPCYNYLHSQGFDTMVNKRTAVIVMLVALCPATVSHAEFFQGIS